MVVVAVVIASALSFYRTSSSLANPQNRTANNVQMQEMVGLPAQLIIPSIGVDAPVINMGLAADGSVGVPKGPSEVAWYQLGPRPGTQGSAVITGHYGPWRDGSHSVFDTLHQLQEGDEIQVKDDNGYMFAFIVRETRMYKSHESPVEVFQKNDGTYLNLITCQGEWLASQKTYTQRLVVFTELKQ